MTEPQSTNNTSSGTGELRRVVFDEEVRVILPHSEACMHMRIAGHLRTIRVLRQGAQILKDDGTRVPFSFPITHGEAGVMVRDTGMWVHPIPATLWVVRRDGVPVSPYMASENDASTWLMRHQAQSVDWACKHNGYSIDSVTDHTETETDENTDQEDDDVTTDNSTSTVDTDTEGVETEGVEVDTAEAGAAPETAEPGNAKPAEQEPAKPRFFLAEYGGYPGTGRGFRRM